MIALCVDDETLLLNALRRAVEQSPDISSVAAFDDEYDAIDWAEHNDFDIAFLDIQLHGMNGLELAERLRAERPTLPVIFCTGYMNYAVDAFRIHADGYLLKPVSRAKVQEEIDHIKALTTHRPLLTVKCYGEFEVYDQNGVLLDFKRSRAKELLAYLVLMDGEKTGSREICRVLFGEDDELHGKSRNYFYHLIRELNRVLEDAHAERVLLKSGGVYCLDMELIRKDNALSGKAPYLGGYYWAL